MTPEELWEFLDESVRVGVVETTRRGDGEPLYRLTPLGVEVLHYLDRGFTVEVRHGRAHPIADHAEPRDVSRPPKGDTLIEIRLELDLGAHAPGDVASLAESLARTVVAAAADTATTAAEATGAHEVVAARSRVTYRVASVSDYDWIEVGDA
jgi:hypothetical protein